MAEAAVGIETKAVGGREACVGMTSTVGVGRGAEYRGSVHPKAEIRTKPVRSKRQKSFCIVTPFFKGKTGRTHPELYSNPFRYGHLPLSDEFFRRHRPNS